MKGFAIALGIPLAMAAMSTSNAQDLMKMGSGATVERVASIGNKQVPLPGGKWEVVLSDTDRRGSVVAGNVFLVQKAGNRLVGYLVVRTNLEGGRGYGWKRPNWCDRANVHHNGSDSNYNIQDADCWILNHRVYTQKVFRSSFRNKVRDYFRKNGYTSTIVGNRFWRNDYQDYILVYHFIDPGAFGFAPEREKRWMESEWHANAVGEGSPRRKFIDAIRAYGEKYRDAVRKGFGNRLGSGTSDLNFAFER